MDFLKQIIKETGNEFASIVDEGVEAGDVASFIDTGSYIFNAERFLRGEKQGFDYEFHRLSHDFVPQAR